MSNFDSPSTTSLNIRQLGKACSEAESIGTELWTFLPREDIKEWLEMYMPDEVCNLVEITKGYDNIQQSCEDAGHC